VDDGLDDDDEWLEVELVDLLVVTDDVVDGLFEDELDTEDFVLDEEVKGTLLDDVLEAAVLVELFGVEDETKLEDDELDAVVETEDAEELEELLVVDVDTVDDTKLEDELVAAEELVDDSTDELLDELDDEEAEDDDDESVDTEDVELEAEEVLSDVDDEDEVLEITALG
jgi:hypothetical protein